MDNETPFKGLSTLSVHAGEYRDERTGAVVTPIFQSSTFLFPYEDHPLRYSRYGNNPTQEVVGERVAALEGAEAGLVFSSGMAAITTTLLTLLKAGDHLVAARDLYGGTYSLITKELARHGVEATLVRTEDLMEWESAIRPSTRVIYFESPTNPTMKIVDIPQVVVMARGRGITVVIDNTFATPINQRPLDMGVDVSIHSATKYLAGHSDLVAGVVVGRRVFVEQLRERMILYGGALDPLAAFLLLRGLKTLAVRVERQNSNGLALARYLAQHPGVKQVIYPGLPSHPQHALARHLLLGFGGVLSIELQGGAKEAETFLRQLRLAKLAPSLGGVDTLVSQPKNTSHAAMRPEERAALGIPEELIRFALGIEDADDLIVDVEQALQKISGNPS